MPSADSLSSRRPGLPHRHSSSSVIHPKSPHDQLSSSVQKQRQSARFVVGNNRLGARNPSFSKNINKLTKLAPSKQPDSPTSPTKPDNVKRNSSNLHLAQNASDTVLRKNHSETSLKKNRSSGHLVKLARPASTRNVASKANKSRHRRARTSVGNIQAPDGPNTPTVRFDLGNEDDNDAGNDSDAQEEDAGSWTYTDSRSPSTTRSSTRRNSVNNVQAAEQATQSIKQRLEPTDRPPSSSLHPDSPSLQRAKTETILTSSSPSTRTPQIMNRLLKRNVSFTDPTLTSNPAHPVMIDPHQPVSQSHNTLNDSSNPEVVSRFLNQSTPASGFSHESSFLPRRTGSSAGPPSASPSTPTSPTKPSEPPTPEPQPQQDQEQEQQQEPVREAPRRNRSLPNFSADYVSRTQQRLNLERESAAAEAAPAAAPPRALVHVSRLGGAAVPFPSAALHVRQLCDRAAVEYRRVRLYQSPLADALARVRDAADAADAADATAASSRRSGRPGARTPTGEAGKTKTQALKGARAGRAAAAAAAAAAADGAVPATPPRRPKVMFQGLKEGDGDGDDERDERPGTGGGSAGDARDVVRDLCARLWVRNTTGLAGGE